MSKLHKIILAFGITLFALFVLTGVSNATEVSPTNTVTPTPTCTPTPTEEPTATPTPTPCQGQLCIVIDCDGGGICEVNTGDPTPTPTEEPTATPTQTPSNTNNGGGDGRSDGGSSGSSSTPTQAVLGVMAPTGAFIQDIMKLMLLCGVIILGWGYLYYGKQKKA